MIIRTLLDKGSDPNIKDEVNIIKMSLCHFNLITQDGNTALHLVFQPHKDQHHFILLLHYRHRCDTIVELLLKGGADPRIKNRVSIVELIIFMIIQ